MKATVTIYVKPADRKKAVESLKSTLGKNIKFFPEKTKYLSWVGETEVEVSNQKEAFRLERELQKIKVLSDIEVIAEDTPQEIEINYRYAKQNQTISMGKKMFPHPAWYHHAVRINEALQYASDAFKAGKGSFNPKTSRINLGMLDTGYSNHPEISKIDKLNGRNFLPGEIFKDALDTLESTRPFPIAWGGHGTSCSAVIIGSKAVIPAAHRLEAEDSYYEDLVEGLLPNNVNVIPYRVSRNIISFTSKMADAITSIVQGGNVPVISMSHASLLNRKIYYAAVREAYEKGIIICAAPGSHVFASGNVFTYPAKYNETIAAAASTVNNVPWRLTHGGPEVDLCAPGYEIYIPWPFKDKKGKLGYVYKWSEGSSFSTPITATAAALWRMHHGDALKKFSPIQQVELFRTIIKATATPFASSSDNRAFGAGIINFQKMLEYPLPSAKSMKGAVAKKTAGPTPQTIFTTNKTEASFLRELTYLKATQFVTNQAKAIREVDYYQESGTEEFKKWMERKTKNKANKEEYIDKLLESQL